MNGTLIFHVQSLTGIYRALICSDAFQKSIWMRMFVWTCTIGNRLILRLPRSTSNHSRGNWDCFCLCLTILVTLCADIWASSLSFSHCLYHFLHLSFHVSLYFAIFPSTEPSFVFFFSLPKAQVRNTWANFYWFWLILQKFGGGLLLPSHACWKIMHHRLYLEIYNILWQ